MGKLICCGMETSTQENKDSEEKFRLVSHSVE